MFWSSDTLKTELGAIVDLFDSDCIETGSYALRLGCEAYVSPIGESSKALTSTIARYDDGDHFAIPPGQFAFLITKETLSMPDRALGLISIKSRFKLSGLVNVSGFHVDPTYKGKLRFTVFNAGPATIHLRVGEPTFLIWLASFDYACEQRKNDGPKRLDASHIISGVVPSFESLRERVEKLEGSNRYLTGVAAFTLSVALLLLGQIILKSADRFPAGFKASSTSATSPTVDVGRQPSGSVR